MKTTAMRLLRLTFGSMLALLLGTNAVAQEAPVRKDAVAAESQSSQSSQSAPAKTLSPTAAAAQPRADLSNSDGAARRATASRADRLDLDTTVVTGNRELPKVLYIVPWKKADIGELPAQPFNTLLDEVLSPVDRDVFRREVTYYEAIAERTDAALGGAAPPTSPSGSYEK